MVALQSLGAAPLLILGIAAVLGFDPAQRRRWLQLVRRSRWLVLVLALTFFFSTPGEALVPGVPGTGEGLFAALEQGGRFLMILAAVAWLLDRCDGEQLMAGLYCLSLPLRRFGGPTERAVARLALVLEYIEAGGHGRGWRALIDEAPEDRLRTIELELPVLRTRDVAACLLALAVVVAAILVPG